VRSRVCGWGNFCTTQQLHYLLADVAVLSSENASDKKWILYVYFIIERGVFVGKEKVARSFGCITERKKQ